MRRNSSIRELVAETEISYKKLIMPHFVTEKKGAREEIPSMPGIYRVGIEDLLRDIEGDMSLGLDKILLFGIPLEKDELGTGAYSENGIIQTTVREIKKSYPSLLVITDVCLCEYTSHGHCGIPSKGSIQNDESLKHLSRTALSHVKAGTDIVAPSDMMDGRVAAIREILDDNGYEDRAILAYSAKYASAFYGPFREAAGSAPQFGDRKTYQMDYRNAREAEREVLLDIDEGADIVMVKPALSYLDIIYRVSSLSDVPVCAYNVSGEYSMVKAIAANGHGDEAALVREILTSIFRAGADMVISYHAREAARNGWLS